MRRLARWLFTFCSAASLLLCVAVCVLWVRSYSSVDQISGGMFGTFWASNESGHIMLLRERLQPVAHGLKWWSLPATPPNRSLSVFPPPASRGNAFRSAVGVPHWLACVALALLPAARARRWYVERRRAAVRRRGNLCPACGYDLRATPDRCPECGAVATAAHVARTGTSGSQKAFGES